RDAQEERCERIPGCARVGSVERRRRVAERERASRRVVLEIGFPGPQEIAAELERVTAGNLRQRRRHRVRFVVGIKETGADEVVRTGTDGRDGFHPWNSASL